jgi:hypothetical protein
VVSAIGWQNILKGGKDINCRIRRDHSTTEIIPKENEIPPEKAADHYKNGQLFGKGDKDD